MTDPNDPATTTIEVTIKNPCLDEDYLKIVKPDLDPFSYINHKADPDDRFIHKAFTLDTVD